MSRAFSTILQRPYPVLYVYIGWARFYDGSEHVHGTHGFLRDNPDDNMELEAFVRNEDGQFMCGAGRGFVEVERLHVVFIARDPDDGNQRKVVGIYAGATASPRRAWTVVTTSDAHRYALEHRPPLSYWPGTSGMRRWARVPAGSATNSHPELLRHFKRLVASLKDPAKGRSIADEVDSDEELEAVEGVPRQRLIWHRTRERRLRQQKMLAARQANDGRLLCEVPGCGFEFERTYGPLGEGFAEVHHLHPLASLSAGTRVSLNDLAVVCANCHRMIHRGGASRPLDSLIKGTRRRRSGPPGRDPRA